MSSTGTSTRSSNALRPPRRRSRPGAATSPSSPTSSPPRKRATSSSGRCVAERPCAGAAGSELRVPGFACRRRRGTAPPRPAGAASPRARRAGSAAAARLPAAPARGPGARRAWCRQGVDLVHDHQLDRLEHRARLRRQHQVQRFGRGDQDVGRRPRQPGPLRPRCRRCAARRSARGPARRAARPPGRCRPAAPAGSARRRTPAPAAARCRAPGSGPAWPAPARTSAGRCGQEAASVLPDPVGARISVCWPAMFLGSRARPGHAVGAAQAPANERRVAG